MAQITSYALQYNDIDVEAVKASTYDLFITEGDPFGDFPSIGDDDVAALRAQGRTVVGYVETCIVEDYRAYWNPAWTDDGTDLGNPTDDAPPWLKDQPKNSFGIITKYWDADWQSIVIGEAVELVQRGYSGVFLDDVGRYWDIGHTAGQPNTATAAEWMMQLVVAVTEAIREINPDAYVVVNDDPYIMGNSGDAGSETSLAFLNAIDAMLLENVPEAWAAAEQNVAAWAQVLALQSSRDGAGDFAADAYGHGFIPYAAPDDGYNELGGYIGPQTSGADLIHGGDGPNRLDGAGGSDTIFAGQGDDRVSGGAGADKLLGETGSDTLDGGRGADRLEGGAGIDHLAGGSGADKFIFSVLEKQSDRIVDLSADDRIDLSAIDANTTKAHNQAFVLMAGFTHHAGEAVLTYQAAKDRTLLRLDVNGDGKADMTVTLDGDHRGFDNFVL